MAREATERSLDLALVGRIHYVRNGMIFNGVTEPKTQGEDGHLVDLVIIIVETDLAIEDGAEMSSIVSLRGRVGAVALEAQAVAGNAQQMVVVAAVRSVTCGATFCKSGLVVERFLAEIADVGVASDADVDRVCLGKSGLLAGMGAVAIDAVAHSAGMGHLR